MQKLPPFPCDSCGQCCRRVNYSEKTAYLDRGDGVCCNFDDKTNLCLNYDTRPLICRVEDYYHQKLSHVYQWEEFVRLNLEICEQFKQDK
ncbi:YkgJ family cysteine cluster protein [Photobacterium phosphoreum]|jgi:hypothetical protein|uniref:YkgJ family cysteine cluster protein n=1 Tax=Photobacterium phosphoreum TaxID=659 RepID=UPI000D17E44F|nr:YkgJ family cysteine cluster protein [Photobacterium phosphoreum]MCD9518542.1 YkgJ family cysteine cluster protein [Photobacterium phosphoreum]PSU64280.1 zinc/iron-chelating domain-containing protein [Photobacterium phosphoreum]PSW17750.1 zinc/iron-chelating domain-containing protein [Photobacterium phosphoreum]